MALRYDLNWESHWCKTENFDTKGNWLGLPDKEFQEFKLNYGTAEWNLRKANTNILPANTIVVDLTPDEATILDRMKPKTRYNIRLARRKGVNVRAVGIEGLDVWYELYMETALRNGLYINGKSYFRSVFASKMECPDKAVQVTLLVACFDDTPLAAMFLILSAHRATYLYGASSSRMRNLMPTYALQWRAMQIAKENCCSTICSASPRVRIRHTRCMAFTSSSRDSAAMCTISSDAGTIRSKRRSMTISAPAR